MSWLSKAIHKVKDKVIKPIVNAVKPIVKTVAAVAAGPLGIAALALTNKHQHKRLEGLIEKLRHNNNPPQQPVVVQQNSQPQSSASEVSIASEMSQDGLSFKTTIKTSGSHA